MTLCGPQIFGADPVNIQWRVVRGDTATLRVEFYEDDEKTFYDITDWSFAATAYDQSGDILDALETASGDGFVDILASPEVTSNWGLRYAANVAELPFDLQVTIDGDQEIIWTPVIGTIYVLGDVTPGGSL
jgi:hypothetical protein